MPVTVECDAARDWQTVKRNELARLQTVSTVWSLEYFFFVSTAVQYVSFYRPLGVLQNGNGRQA